MTIAWQGEELLLPISPDQPCGASLEDTVLLASFDALRLFGQPESPEAPPDPADRDKETRKGKQPFEWAVIRGNALEALATSKDLRLLAYLGAAMLRTDGLPAFFRTLTIASTWLDSYWPLVYPLVDEDAIARRNALNCFSDPMAVVEWIRRVTLVDSRQHGKYSLREIELAGGQGMSGVAGGDLPPQVAQINAAFAEMPIGDLTGLQQQVADALVALNSIDARMRTEGGPEVAPSFDPLSAPLVRINRLLREKLASRVDAAVAPDAVAGGAAAATAAGPVPVGTIRSRQDAVRALEAVAEYFRQHEPSSPIPMFLERAKRLVAKDFLEVLADIAPEALAVARLAGGVRNE